MTRGCVRVRVMPRICVWVRMTRRGSVRLRLRVCVKVRVKRRVR